MLQRILRVRVGLQPQCMTLESVFAASEEERGKISVFSLLFGVQITQILQQT